MVHTPPDISVSWQLASDLLSAVDFAMHHARHHGNDTAAVELAGMRLYLAYEIDASIDEHRIRERQSWTRTE